jgi:hypothetical protein
MYSLLLNVRSLVQALLRTPCRRFLTSKVLEDASLPTNNQSKNALLDALYLQYLSSFNVTLPFQP